MAGQIFRMRLHDDVGTVFEWTVKQGRRPGVVITDQRAVRSGQRMEPAEIRISIVVDPGASIQTRLSLSGASMGTAAMRGS